MRTMLAGDKQHWLQLSMFIVAKWWLERDIGINKVLVQCTLQVHGVVQDTTCMRSCEGQHDMHAFMHAFIDSGCHKTGRVQSKQQECIWIQGCQFTVCDEMGLHDLPDVYASQTANKGCQGDGMVCVVCFQFLCCVYTCTFIRCACPPAYFANIKKSNTSLHRCYNYHCQNPHHAHHFSRH